MKNITTYKLRPAYNSSELLIEFIKIQDSNTLLKELIEILERNGFKCKNTSEIWMNDEIWIDLVSSNGGITITKDIWDFVFILGEKNQADIKKIDEILCKTDSYKKEPSDFSKYKTNKK